VKDLGNAFHGVMQHIVLTRSRELTEQLEKVMAFQLERYSATQYSERLAKMVQKTLASSLLERIFSADNVEPELPMSEINEDGVVVEGFADLVIREGNDLTVIDYKTNLELNESKVSQYRAQLEGYSKILESATGLKVKERLLWHVLPEKIQEISV
jgi:ATP-dependent helicase/nuclease subunit A